MRVLTAAVTVAAALANGATAAVPTGADLGGWKVERARYQCSLTRTKGPKFEIEVSDSLGTATLFAFRDVPGDFRKREAEISFQPSGTSFTSTSSAEWIYGGLVIFDIPAAMLDAISRSNGLLISVAGKKKFDFRFGPPAAAVQALRACHAAMLRSWGVDPALLSSLGRQPIPLEHDEPWISRKELEAIGTEAMARYGGGTTALTYVVQTDGTIGDCRTVISSGLPTLDDFACQSLSRNARFEPALNAQGQAAPVKVADVVHWAFI